MQPCTIPNMLAVKTARRPYRVPFAPFATWSHQKLYESYSIKGVKIKYNKK